jgi:hypothetical protein
MFAWAHQGGASGGVFSFFGMRKNLAFPAERILHAAKEVSTEKVQVRKN